MAVRTKEELLASIKARFGEDTSDESITLLEDVADTIGDYESRSGEDWKKKYEENDSSWRKKYTDRFFNPPDSDEDKGDEEEKPVPRTFEDLFK